MALRPIDKHILEANYRGYDEKGIYRRFYKQFPRTREGRAQAEAWLVLGQSHKKAPPKKKESDPKLRTIRSAVEYYISRSHFTSRQSESQKKETANFNRFLAWCDTNGLAFMIQFNQSTAEQYASYCIKNHKRKGIEKKIALAGRVFKVDMLRDDPCVTANPFRNVKKTGYDPPLGIKRLTEDQIARALGVIQPRDAALMMILFESGMRADELQNLRWQEVKPGYIDLSSRESTSGETGFYVKAQEDARIPMTDNMALSFEYLHNLTGNWKYVILGRRAACKSYLNKRMARFEKKVRETHSDIPHFSPHILRHSIAMFLIDNDEKLHKVQRFLRHKSIKTTEKYYGRAFTEHLASSVEKINNGCSTSILSTRLKSQPQEKQWVIPR